MLVCACSALSSEERAELAAAKRAKQNEGTQGAYRTHWAVWEVSSRTVSVSRLAVSEHQHTPGLLSETSSGMVEHAVLPIDCRGGVRTAATSRVRRKSSSTSLSPLRRWWEPLRGSSCGTPTAGRGTPTRAARAARRCVTAAKYGGVAVTQAVVQQSHSSSVWVDSSLPGRLNDT